MWQLRKLSTNEALSEAGPLPNNWGPIFGLEGFKEKLGDLSWIGPDYADQGWVELNKEEVKACKKLEVAQRVEKEKTKAKATMSESRLTVEQKQNWDKYLKELDEVLLQADLHIAPRMPVSP